MSETSNEMRQWLNQGRGNGHLLLQRCYQGAHAVCRATTRDTNEIDDVAMNLVMRLLKQREGLGVFLGPWMRFRTLAEWVRGDCERRNRRHDHEPLDDHDHSASAPDPGEEVQRRLDPGFLLGHVRRSGVLSDRELHLFEFRLQHPHLNLVAVAQNLNLPFGRTNALWNRLVRKLRQWAAQEGLD